MEKILVTGASGLLGRYVVKELVSTGKYDVTAIISGKRQVDFGCDVRVEVANLLEPSERERVFKKVQPQICCHFAWALLDGGFQRSALNLEWLEASLHILRLFQETGGRHFFFAGSSSEYGNGTKGNCEELKAIERTLYGQSKVAFEETASIFCKWNDIKYTTGRYFSVYGPWDIRADAALPTAIQSMLQGKKFVCKAPNNLWDFVYVEDCAKATAELIQQGCCGCYNIASGRPLTMRQVFDTVAKEIGAKGLMSYEENFEQISLTADVSKLFRDTGFCCDTSFEEGMKKTIAWWKDYLKQNE